MKVSVRLLGFACVAALGAGRVWGASPALKALDASVGRNLEAPATVALGDPAQEDDFEVTIRSSDPARLRVSKAADKAGSESIVVTVRQGFRVTPQFWLQGLDSSGTATYTAEAKGYTAASGTVTLTPSGIAIVGPFRAPTYATTTGGAPTKLTVQTVALDSTGKAVAEQMLAGGISIPITMDNSNPAAGSIESPSVTIPGGRGSFLTHFHPSSEGQAEITIKPPQGFSKLVELGSWTVSVRKPGLAISDQLNVGRDLQVSGVLALGQFPPEDGVRVTLKSSDPKRMVLSSSATKMGAESIEITVPPNEATARYYIQAFGDSGTVEYTASAPGFRPKTATVTLAPSGVVITPVEQGPPDEAQVVRQDAGEGTYRMYVDLAKPFPMKVVAWTAQLDPITHHSADITVQPLRAGVDLNVKLTNSKPDIGKIETEIKIRAGSDNGVADFTPLSKGSTQISVITPEGFTPSANSTSVIAFVR